MKYMKKKTTLYMRNYGEEGVNSPCKVIFC